MTLPEKNSLKGLKFGAVRGRDEACRYVRELLCRRSLITHTLPTREIDRRFFQRTKCNLNLYSDQETIISIEKYFSIFISTKKCILCCVGLSACFIVANILSFAWRFAILVNHLLTPPCLLLIWTCLFVWLPWSSASTALLRPHCVRLPLQVTLTCPEQLMMLG